MQRFTRVDGIVSIITLCWFLHLTLYYQYKSSVPGANLPISWIFVIFIIFILKIYDNVRYLEEEKGVQNGGG